MERGHFPGRDLPRSRQPPTLRAGEGTGALVLVGAPGQHPQQPPLCTTQIHWLPVSSPVGKNASRILVGPFSVETYKRSVDMVLEPQQSLILSLCDYLLWHRCCPRSVSWGNDPDSPSWLQSPWSRARLRPWLLLCSSTCHEIGQRHPMYTPNLLFSALTIQRRPYLL